MSHVLVTGGAGYIGSHTCKALHLAGYIPVTLDNISTGHQWAVKWGPFVEGNMGDAELIKEIIHTYEPIAVMHFAARIDVAESMDNPFLYYEHNAFHSLTLIKSFLQKPIPFIYSSSCATYGMPQSLPIREDHPQNPINPYGWSKLIVERMLLDAYRSHSLPYMILRYFNAAGADPDGELGESHPIETHLIPLAIQTALGQRDHLSIFGDDYSTPDGTAIRDYIHVTDLAHGHVLALNHLLAKRSPCTLNLGTGIGHSVKQIVDAVKTVSGCDVPIHIAPRRVGDPPLLVADPAKATRILNFSPAHSNLNTVIETALAWQQVIAC